MAPVIEALLQRGFRHGDILEIVSEDLVRAALDEGRRSDAEIEKRTGVPKRSIARIRRDTKEQKDLPLPYAIATRLVSRWTHGREFTKGRLPRTLPLQGERSFATLAEMAGVDAAIALPALKRAGIVRVVKGRVSLQKDAYVPAGEIEKLDILGRDGAEFLRAIIHNTGAAPGQTMLQRKASYDNIGSASLKDLRNVLRGEAGRALQAADRVLATNDRDRSRSARRGKRTRVSFGVYIAEEPVELQGRSHASRSKRRRRP
jgi:hypothetical protein